MLSPGVRPDVNSTPGGYFVAKIIPGYMEPVLYKYTGSKIEITPAANYGIH